MGQEVNDFINAGKALREKAEAAAVNEADNAEFSQIRYEGTMARAREAVNNLRHPELREQEFAKIRLAQHDYKEESSGLSAEYLLKLAVLLDLEPHELLNPEDPEAVFEKLRQQFSYS